MATNVQSSNSLSRKTSNTSDISDFQENLGLTSLVTNPKITTTTANNVHSTTKVEGYNWESCYYCPRENFKAVNEFVK